MTDVSVKIRATGNTVSMQTDAIAFHHFMDAVSHQIDQLEDVIEPYLDDIERAPESVQAAAFTWWRLKRVAVPMADHWADKYGEDVLFPSGDTEH